MLTQNSPMTGDSTGRGSDRFPGSQEESKIGIVLVFVDVVFYEKSIAGITQHENLFEPGNWFIRNCPSRGDQRERAAAERDPSDSQPSGGLGQPQL